MRFIHKDISGLKKGIITVLHRVEDVSDRPAYLCECRCGKTRVIPAKEITRNRTLYVTCICNNQQTKEFRSHPLYDVWKGMRARCYNPNHISFKNYGGRGITVCSRWDSFINFFDDLAGTYTEGLVLDRENNDGNYEPANCRWVTSLQNGRNTRQCKLNPEIAKEIRLSNLPTKELAQKHQVTKGAIRHIKTGLTWY